MANDDEENTGDKVANDNSEANKTNATGPANVSSMSASYVIAFFAFVAIRCSLGVIYKLASRSGEFTFSPNSAIVLAEVVKFCMSLSAVSQETGFEVPVITDTIRKNSLAFRAYVLLAFFYFLTNQIVFYAISNGDPFFYELSKSFTPFLVPVMLHFFTPYVVTGLEWTSISIQTGCLILLTTDSCKNSSPRITTTLFLVLAFAAVNTAVCSIINEKLIKGCPASLQFQNSFLYFFGIGFNLLGFWFTPQNDKGFFEGYFDSVWPLLVVLVNACFGIAISAVYKYCDVVAKTFASSTALCVLQYISWMFFGLELNLHIIIVSLMTAVVSVQYFILIPQETANKSTVTKQQVSHWSRLICVACFALPGFLVYFFNPGF